jgi:hypothetical protein
MDAVQILDKHFSANWKNRTCTICGSNNWNIVPDIFSMPKLGGAATTAIPTLPVLSAVCSQCGQMLLFNAVSLGLVTGQPLPTQAAPPPAGKM